MLLYILEMLVFYLANLGLKFSVVRDGELNAA